MIPCEFLSRSETIVVGRRPSKPRPDEAAEVGQEIASSVDEHEREQIFCSRPDYAKRDSAYRDDDDGISSCVQ